MRSSARPYCPRARTAHAAGWFVRGVGSTVLLATLAGCGLRLEAPPPELPSPDAAEVARQGAAARAEALADLASDTAAGLPDAVVAAALDRVADDAAAHAAALGGVWSPPTWAEPTPDDSTPDAADVTPAIPDAGTVLDAVLNGAVLTCADAVVSADPDLAVLLASICLAQEDAGRDLAAAIAVETPPVRPAPTSDGGDSAAEALGDVGAALGLARALDAAGYALEVAAARTTGADREVLAARAAGHRADAQALVAAAGALGTTNDPRRAAYDLDAVRSSNAAALAAAVETDVLAAWAAAFGDAPLEARAAVLDEMATAHAAGQGWGAPSSAFPGLPDLRP